MEDRQFTGTVLWDDSSKGGNVRWDYTMIFSEDFEKIEGGEVISLSIDGSQSSIAFGSQLNYKKLQ